MVFKEHLCRLAKASAAATKAPKSNGEALMWLGWDSWPRNARAGKQGQGKTAAGILRNAPKELVERWTFQR